MGGLIIEVICTRTSQELQDLCKSYKKIYKKDLITEIERETSGNFKRICVRLLQGKQEENMHDDFQIALDCDKLYKAGENKLGTDEGVFIRLLTGQPRSYVEKLFWMYAEKYHKSLDRVIKSEFSGKLRRAFLALATPLYIYYSEKFYDCMKGLGTDDET